MMTSTVNVSAIGVLSTEITFHESSFIDVPAEDILIWEDYWYYDLFDPHTTNDPHSWDIFYNIYETLYTSPFNESSIRPDLPLLASALPSVSPDGLNYTIILRQGITFHDGTPFNASCVKWNFERGMKIFSPIGSVWTYAELLVGGKIVSEIADEYYPQSSEFKAVFDDWIATSGAIEVIDLYTIRFVLEEPNEGFLAVLSTPCTSMMSPTYAIAHASDPSWATWDTFGVDYGEEDNWMHEHTCGTGPYTLKALDWNEFIELDKSNVYWRDSEIEPTLVPPSYAGSIDQIRINTNTDDNTRQMNLEAGAIDGCYTSTSNADTFYDQETGLSLIPGVHVSTEGYGLSQIFFGFNMEGIQTDSGKIVSPFDDIHFRKAASWAFDYETLIDVYTNGMAVRSKGILPIGSYGHNGSAFSYNFNITEAVTEWNLAMMNSSFVDALNAMECALYVGYNEGNTYRELMCELFAEGLELIYDSPQANHTGLNFDLTTDIHPLEWSTYSDYLKTDRLAIVPTGMNADYEDPDNHLSFFAYENGSIASRIGYSNPEVNNLYLLQRNETNPIQRQIYLDQIQSLIAEDCVYTWLYQTTEFRTWRNWLQGSGLIYRPLYSNGGLYFYHIYKPGLTDVDEPVLDSPSDLVFDYETTGQSIIWSPTDPYPDSYRLYIDGAVEEYGLWNGLSISIELENLEPGVYEYTIVVFDLALNYANDSVIVTVVDPSVTTTTTTSTTTTGHTYTVGGIPISDIVTMVLMIGLGALGAVAVLVILIRTKPS